MRYSLGEIAKIIGGELIGDETRSVYGVSTDTRTIKRGEIFFAIRGERFNGEDFVEDAIRKGAAGAVVSKSFGKPVKNIIRVEDTIDALGRFASHHRRSFKTAKVIAVTGSTGKTTTKEMIYHALKGSFRCHRNPKSFNNFIGVPLTILQADEDVEVLISELGTNHPGEIERLTAIVRPHIAIITSIGRSHLEFFNSVEAVAREKASILNFFDGPGIAIVNEDTGFLELFKNRAEKTLTVSVVNEEADFYARVEHMDFENVEFVVNGKYRLELRPGGFGTVYGALFALATGEVLGVPTENLIEGLKEFRGVGMRKELVRFKNFTVLNDAYNANPDSMEDFFKTLLPYKDRVVLVLGDMFELGEKSEYFHREIGRKIRELGFKKLLTIGKFAEFYNIEAGDLEINEHFRDHDEVVEALLKMDGEVFVALKASRAMELEKIVEKLRRM